MEVEAAMLGVAAIVISIAALFKQKYKRKSRRFWVNPYLKQRLASGRFQQSVRIFVILFSFQLLFKILWFFFYIFPTCKHINHS